MENKKGNKKAVIGVAALAAAVVVFAVIFLMFRPKPAEGSKSVTIEVVNQSSETESYPLKTDAQFLRQAMEEAEGLTFSGAESEYGMMVDTVNGVKADYTADGAYWAFYVNGEYCKFGIEEQPVLDGDVFSIVYTAAQ